MRTARPPKRYRDLAERFRTTPRQLADHELAELRGYALEAGNYRLERETTEALLGDDSFVLTAEQASVVCAALEVVREDRYHHGLAAPVSTRAGRSVLDTMLVVDGVVDTIQRRRST